MHAVPFSALSVGAGGFDHDHLVLTWNRNGVARTLYIKDAALISAFRRAAPPELSSHIERTAEIVRRVRYRRRAVLLLVCGGILALALGLRFGSESLVAMAVDRIPPEWEKQFGEPALEDFLAHQTVLREGPVVDAVQEMTRRLTDQIPESPYRFEVTVVKSPVVNAFALPGGYIVVFTGLIKEAESPEEVAGVLGHEVNHILQRHGVERIVKTLGVITIAAILLGDQQRLVRLAKELGVEIVTLKFSRDQETEADVTGLRLLHKARIDPAGMIDFFERLSQSEKEKQRMEFLSTHPMSVARAERLKAELATLPKFLPEPFTFQWDMVQTSLKPKMSPPER